MNTSFANKAFKKVTLGGTTYIRCFYYFDACIRLYIQVEDTLVLRTNQYSLDVYSIINTQNNTVVGEYPAFRKYDNHDYHTASEGLYVYELRAIEKLLDDSVEAELDTTPLKTLIKPELSKTKYKYLLEQ